MSIEVAAQLDGSDYYEVTNYIVDTVRLGSWKVHKRGQAQRGEPKPGAS